MPALCKRRGVLRWKGVVRPPEGKQISKWFGPGKKGGKEYKKALIWEEEKKTEIEKMQAETERTPTEYSKLTLRSWANQRLAHVERTKAKKTLTEVKTTFKFLGTSLGPEFPVEDIDPKTALAHLNEQCDARSGNAANKDRKNLLSGWKWARKYIEGFPQVPCPFEVEKYPEDRTDRYVPPEQDFWILYESLEGQDQVMMLAMLHLAARRCEVFDLKWSSINWRESQIALLTRKTKDGKPRIDWVPLTDKLRKALLWQWENRQHQSEYVFTVCGSTPFTNQWEGDPFKNRRHFMTRACERAGIKPFGFHAIRHLSATIMYHQGRKVAEIQAILRHQSPSTTERYLKRLGLDPAKLRETVAVFDDRGPDFDPKKQKTSEKIPAEV